MKQLITVFITLLLYGISAFCQPLEPLSWEVSCAPDSNGLAVVTARGSFTSPDWHIYDMKDYVDGPYGTVFSVSGEGIQTVGEPWIASEVETSFSPAFGFETGTCSAPVILKQKVKGNGDAQVHIEWQCCNAGSCLPPSEYDTTVSVAASDGTPAPLKHGSKSLWALILEAVAWGFIALLTPCVFPMVPMTVSFFLKRKGKGLAVVFGLSIILLYTLPIALLILISLLSGGQAVTADIFNWLATHWIPNLLFFLIFMVFAASFFGAFELRLPSSLVNKSDAKADRGGIVGAFFVALTLVLVSFSCTGPIVGSVLIKSAQGEFWEPVLTMLAFSVAFALPFTVLALVPSLLKKLPRSGGWLNSVKVTLGFIELALGLKFLSVADQTYHWGILDREIYLAIWIVIFTLLGLYLLGKIRFANDSPVEHIGVTRLLLSIVVFSFVVYMVPGMVGAPLKGLSGYLPPITTQDFVIGQYEGTKAAAGDVSRKYSDVLKLPYGIDAYFDYGQAREAAIASGKPLFVDFTGHGCVNCREMESRVWSDPEVLALLKNDFIVCALYADDKMILPEEDWITVENGKVLKSLGKVNSHFALERFNVNAQPFYAILDPVGEGFLCPSRGYDLSVEGFLGFLRSGLEAWGAIPTR